MCSRRAFFVCPQHSAERKTQPSSKKKSRRRRTMMRSKRGPPEPDARDEREIELNRAYDERKQLCLLPFQFPRIPKLVGEGKKSAFVVIVNNIPRISPSNSGRTRANGRRPAETPPAARPPSGTSCRSPPGAYEPSP